MLFLLWGMGLQFGFKNGLPIWKVLPALCCFLCCSWFLSIIANKGKVLALVCKLVCEVCGGLSLTREMVHAEIEGEALRLEPPSSQCCFRDTPLCCGFSVQN